MGIDELGVDEMGVDEMGSRRSGMTPCHHLCGIYEHNYNSVHNGAMLFSCSCIYRKLQL